MGTLLTLAQKSDWSVLKGRDVTLWPDHDQPGRNAAQKIVEILHEQHVSSIKIVNLPTTPPHKWDLADKLPEGFQHSDLKEILHNAKNITLDKTSEPTHLLLQQVENIDHIMKNNRLDLSFGALGDKDYQYIHHAAKAFKQVQNDAGKPIDEDWILKRATFMVCYLKDQIHHTNLTPEETQKLALIASKQFADQREQGTLASNSDAHFKARAFLHAQERNLEPNVGQPHLFAHGERQDEREKLGAAAKSLSQRSPSLDNPGAEYKEGEGSPALTKSEQNLQHLIHRINHDYRTAYESQQLQQSQKRQLRLMKDRER